MKPVLLEKSDNKFFGNYRATVKSNVDPLDEGRLKVLVHGVYDENIRVDSLPWAIPAQPLYHDKIKTVPNIGQEVWVFFDSGNHLAPVYFATAVGGPDWPADKKSVTSVISALRTKITLFLVSLFSPSLASLPTLTIDDVGSNKDISYIHTRAGTTIVVDHTTGKEKLYVFDKDVAITSDTFKQFTSGNSEEGVGGDKKTAVKGTINTVGGGNSSEEILGVKTISAQEISLQTTLNLNLQSGVTLTLSSLGQIVMTGQKISLAANEIDAVGTAVTIYSAGSPLLLKGPATVLPVP